MRSETRDFSLALLNLNLKGMRSLTAELLTLCGYQRRRRYEGTAPSDASKPVHLMPAAANSMPAHLLTSPRGDTRQTESIQTGGLGEISVYSSDLTNANMMGTKGCIRASCSHVGYERRMAFRGLYEEDLPRSLLFPSHQYLYLLFPDRSALPEQSHSLREGLIFIHFIRFGPTQSPFYIPLVIHPVSNQPAPASPCVPHGPSWQLPLSAPLPLGLRTSKSRRRTIRKPKPR